MSELQKLRTAVVDGDAAGALVVTGITTSDRLIAVIDVAAAGANLASEFTISDDDEIDNTGGTDTTSMVLLVVWEAVAALGGDKFGDQTFSDVANIGRSRY